MFEALMPFVLSTRFWRNKLIGILLFIIQSFFIEIHVKCSVYVLTLVSITHSFQKV
jgi:hypothetical protein